MKKLWVFLLALCLISAVNAQVKHRGVYTSKTVHGRTLAKEIPIEPPAHTVYAKATYGLVGDGVTDDWNKFRLMAAAFCADPVNTKLVFEVGTYRLNQTRSVYPGNSIQWSHCNGKTVAFASSAVKIDNKGDFYRVDVTTEPIVPFVFIDSSNWTFNGDLTGLGRGEIDGNADQMTQAYGQSEGFDPGITTTRCSNYVIKNLKVHHFASDSICIGANSEISDVNGTVTNCELYASGRLCLTVLCIDGFLSAYNLFYDGGRVGGSYGYHLPAGGVDVEPERKPPVQDRWTRNIVFDHDTFNGSLKMEFSNAWAHRVQDVTLRYATFNLDSADDGDFIMINGSQVAITEYSTFNFASCTPGQFLTTSYSPSLPWPYITQEIYRYNTINSVCNNLWAAPPTAGLPLHFTSNKVNDGAQADNVSITGWSSITNNQFGLPSNRVTLGATTVSGNTYNVP